MVHNSVTYHLLHPIAAPAGRVPQRWLTLWSAPSKPPDLMSHVCVCVFCYKGRSQIGVEWAGYIGQLQIRMEKIFSTRLFIL